MESGEQQFAVISGGAGGIGRAVTLRLAAAGFFPVILDRNEEAGRALVEELARQGRSADFIDLDLTGKALVEEAFRKIASRFGRIDALVNHAGGTLHARRIQDFPLNEWQEVIDVNLKGTFLCCQAVIGPMKQEKRGVIINTSSNFGISGSATRTAYSASKTAVIGFSKSLALELAPYGIRVNAIAPGLTATDRVMSGFSSRAWTDAGKAIPAGRTADPRDIAEGVAFLVSEEAAYITGQTLHVNGGLVFP